MHSVFNDLHTLSDGSVYGPSFMSNGRALCVGYRKRIPGGDEDEGGEGEGGEEGGAPAVAADDGAAPPSSSRRVSFAVAADSASPRAPRPPPRRPNTDAPPPSTINDDNCRNLGVDAGGIYLAYVWERVVDPVTGEDKDIYYRLSRNEWRARRKDEARHAKTRRWCAHLARPGGEYDQLRTVTDKTTNLDALRAFCAVAHGTRATGDGVFKAILDERLKPRWAHADFRTWTSGRSILHSFWADILKGDLQHGTAGRRVRVHYGNAKFSTVLRGHVPSPTCAMFTACVDVIGPDRVIEVSEHRTTRCCAECGEVLHRVMAPTPERVYDTAERRRNAPLPHGWQPWPARPIPVWSVVRGEVYCANPLCPANGFHHRDGNASKGIGLNGISEMNGWGRVEYMTKMERPWEPRKAPLFWLTQPLGGPGAPMPVMPSMPVMPDMRAPPPLPPLPRMPAMGAPPPTTLSGLLQPMPRLPRIPRMPRMPRLEGGRGR